MQYLKNYVLKKYNLLKLIMIFTTVSGIGCSNITEPDSSYLREDRSPSWSADGKNIAYYHYDEKNEKSYPTGLYIMDMEGGNRKLIREGISWSPTWSPDGRQIAFIDRSNVYTIKTDGTDLKKILELKEISMVRWSPDNSKLLVVSETKKINIYSFMTNQTKFVGPGTWANWIKGGETMILNKGAELMFCNTQGITKGTFYKINLFEDIGFSVSPYDSIAAIRKKGGVIQIFNLEGKYIKHFLADGGQISFSPDSKYIVFPRSAGHTKYILIKLELETMNERQITY